jgi:hypothetical protein
MGFDRVWATAFLCLTMTAVVASADAQDRVPCAMGESIGTATMGEDGVITLRLRSLPPGPIAEGTLRYRRGNRQYQKIMQHLDGIAPGEIEPVRPWC